MTTLRETTYLYLSKPVTERERIAQVLGVSHEGQAHDDFAVMTEVRRRGLLDDLRAELQADASEGEQS